MNSITEIIGFVSFVLALSIASEKLVEIIKAFFPNLNLKKEGEQQETKRQTWIQFIAIISGLVSAFLVCYFIEDNGYIDSVGKVFAFGLLASGGSGVWNSILSYLLHIKDIKGNVSREGELRNTEKQESIKKTIIENKTAFEALKKGMREEIVRDLKRELGDKY